MLYTGHPDHSCSFNTERGLTGIINICHIISCNIANLQYLYLRKDVKLAVESLLVVQLHFLQVQQSARPELNWSREIASLEHASNRSLEKTSLEPESNWSREKASLEPGLNWSREKASLEPESNWSRKKASLEPESNWSRKKASLEPGLSW